MAGFFDVGLGGEGEFEVAGAEVADVRDVAGEALPGDGVFNVDSGSRDLGIGAKRDNSDG